MTAQRCCTALFIRKIPRKLWSLNRITGKTGQPVQAVHGPDPELASSILIDLSDHIVADCIRIVLIDSDWNEPVLFSIIKIQALIPRSYPQPVFAILKDLTDPIAA